MAAGVGEVAHRALVQGKPERPHIARVRVGLTLYPLGAHVGHRAHERAALAERVLQLRDAAEVGDARLAREAEQDVLRLQVAVDQPALA